MKFYFIVIIVVLVVVICLLFLILFKIYKLHIKSTEEDLDIFEQQELLSSEATSSKESTEFSYNSSEPKEFLNHDLIECRSIDITDGIQGKVDFEEKEIQPDDTKEIFGSHGSLEGKKFIIPKQQTSFKHKPHLKLLLQYDQARSILKILIKHVDGKLKSKPGSSESYVDVQISAYRFRTYRSPGYRRPARSVIRKQIEFQLDAVEVKTTFLLIFLLRYDPFSRLKVDGEVAVKLSELDNRGFLQGCQVELSKEITRSNQDFTAFIFRPK